MTSKSTTIHKAFGLEDKFYIGENKTAQNKTISFELVGLIAYLSSLPKDWKINAGDIMRTGCGRSKAYKLLSQLEKIGFLKRDTIRRDDGTVQEFTITFYAMREENPECKTEEFNQLIGLQDVAEQDVDNQLLQSKEVKKEKKEQTPALVVVKKDSPIAPLELMEQAVKKYLKAYGTQNKKIAKSLLCLLTGKNEDMNINKPITPKQLGFFVAHWDRTKIGRDSKPLTRPRNQGSVKTNVDVWLDELDKKQAKRDAPKIPTINATELHIQSLLGSG